MSMQDLISCASRSEAIADMLDSAYHKFVNDTTLVVGGNIRINITATMIYSLSTFGEYYHVDHDLHRVVKLCAHDYDPDTLHHLLDKAWGEYNLVQRQINVARNVSGVLEISV